MNNIDNSQAFKAFGENESIIEQWVDEWSHGDIAQICSDPGNYSIFSNLMAQYLFNSISNNKFLEEEDWRIKVNSVAKVANLAYYFHQYPRNENKSVLLERFFERILGPNNKNQSIPDAIYSYFIASQKTREESFKAFCVSYNIRPSSKLSDLKKTKAEAAVKEYLKSELAAGATLLLQEASSQVIKDLPTHTCFRASLANNLAEDTCIIVPGKAEGIRMVPYKNKVNNAFYDDLETYAEQYHQLASEGIKKVLEMPLLKLTDFYNIFDCQIIKDNVYLPPNIAFGPLEKCKDVYSGLLCLLRDRLTAIEISENSIIISYHGLHNGLSRDYKVLLTMIFIDFWMFVNKKYHKRVLIAGDFNIPLRLIQYPFVDSKVFDLVLNSYQSEAYLFSFLRKTQLVPSVLQKLDYFVNFKTTPRFLCAPQAITLTSNVEGHEPVKVKVEWSFYT